MIEQLEEQPIHPENGVPDAGQKADAGRQKGDRGVGQQDADQGHGAPAEARADGQQASGEQGGGDHGEGRGGVHLQGGEGRKKGESGNPLAFVAQGAPDHEGTHQQQHGQAHHGAFDHPRFGDAMRGKGAEVEHRPTAAQQANGEDLIARLAFEPHAGRNHAGAGQQADGNLANGA